MISEDVVTLVHVMTHPVRYSIINLLREGSNELYITEFAEKLEISNRLASFHLGTLLQHELVKGTWRVSEVPRSKGKAVKYYKITEKARRLLIQRNL